jgi:hypothetical protein
MSMPPFLAKNTKVLCTHDLKKNNITFVRKGTRGITQENSETSYDQGYRRRVKIVWDTGVITEVSTSLVKKI